MAEVKRLSKIAGELGVGVNTLVEFLQKKGYADYNPNTKVNDDVVSLLEKEFSKDKSIKVASEQKFVDKKNKPRKQIVSVTNSEPIATTAQPVDSLKGPKVVGKIDLDAFNKQKPVENKKEQPIAEKKVEILVEEQSKPKVEQQEPVAPVEPVSITEKKETASEPSSDVFRISDSPKISGPNVVGKINLPVAKNDDHKRNNKKKRQRIAGEKVDVSSVSAMSHSNNNSNRDKKGRSDDKKNKQGGQNNNQQGGGKNKEKKSKRPVRQEISEEDVQKQVKDTLARLTAKTQKSKGSKHRRDKRETLQERRAEEAERMEIEKKILKVTEFVTANELASMMDVPVNQVIATFMTLGMFVSINQRLDAETMVIVAEEFGFKIEFISVEDAETNEEEVDDESLLVERPPIVTVMGHVDHGKTSLLDYIRKSDVLSGEAGGITQHIGAYAVKLENGRQITFLDTPGHEAFTAMRARGARVTDVAIIIVAADDSVKPQTIEAINHASAAGVPIIFAINKIDKPGANPDKIREALANMNYLVEEWGGKYQCQEISAKKGLNIDKLLEKVLLEADLLELKANPDRLAVGNVIESSLQTGKGYTTTMLVSNGTLNIGDMVVCGSFYGHVKAMTNERGQRVTKATPATPVEVLGLNGAPTAGEKFTVYTNEKEAKQIANKREQLQREQKQRTHKHIGLDEIGRRIAIGNFQELNIIVKGDVDGSIEAITDSLIKLSTEEIQVRVIHKAVGQISESDVSLAAASEAIIVGFQVRPSMAARKLAEKEEIDIRLYSIIFDAIEEIKSAMEGMLSPEIKEQVTGTLEVRETFKIGKVGTIAGCFVTDGKVKSKSKVRVIRDGIVVHSGALGSLKRFKDDAKEVIAGLDCGLNIEGYNDIQTGDIIEAYEETEVARKL